LRILEEIRGDRGIMASEEVVVVVVVVVPKLGGDAPAAILAE